MMDEDYIFSILKKNIVEIMTNLDIKSITMQESLRELGLNSIDRADVLLQTMETLQVNAPMIEFASAQNIGEIVRVFKNCHEQAKKQ